MMILFFNYDGDLRQASELFFKSLGVSQYFKGDSSNVLGGEYMDFSVLGMKIKLEYNSYDYEDDYAYMVTIGKDLTSTLEADDLIVELVGKAIKRLLFMNLSITIAEEKNNKLEIVGDVSK